MICWQRSQPLSRAQGSVVNLHLIAISEAKSMGLVTEIDTNYFWPSVTDECLHVEAERGLFSGRIERTFPERRENRSELGKEGFLHSWDREEKKLFQTISDMKKKAWAPTRRNGAQFLKRWGFHLGSNSTKGRGVAQPHARRLGSL
ncbi:hypothetical protein VNO77_04464 [Canavalia gladiata]|uniref:Uncharacterized protein n=1 Tax=Canavalia gladiata TaxID=3824 RepID=A0AAN9N1N7_CANGL